MEASEQTPATEPEQAQADEEAPDRNPAEEQAPVATAAQERIMGDPAMRDEQQPLQAEGNPAYVDNPVRTSSPPPEFQSGMPLPEDRAAAAAADEEQQEGAQEQEAEADKPAEA